MATRKKWKGAKEKRDGKTFVPFPHQVLNSVAYISLSPHARMLLIDIAAQYKGNNNGDLSAPWVYMKPRGWRSEATLNKAKKELIDSELIVESRKGARPNKATLYALTWLDLDECAGKLDITHASFPRGAYLRKNSPLTTTCVVESIR